MIRVVKDIVRYRVLIAELVTTDLKQRYRRSYLGVLWSLLNPLLLAAALWLVFTHLRTRGTEENFALFLLSGLIMFQFFQQGTQQGMMGIIQYRAISENVPIPRDIGPIAVVASNLVNFGFTVLAYVIVSVLMGQGLPASFPLIIPVALMGTMMTAGLALLLATSFVFFRDLQHLTAVAFRALFFLTPVFYDVEHLGAELGDILKFNPVYYPVVASRAVLFEGVAPPLEVWAVGFGMAIAMLMAGSALFNALEQRLVYHF